MSTSSDGKNNPKEDGVEEPWFQVMVPRYVKAGDTFRVTNDDERGKFSMHVLCPTGAAGGSKIEFHRSDGSTRIANINDTSTSESSCASDSEGEGAKQDPGLDNMAWYGVFVPDHVSTGGIFRVHMKNRSRRKMVWVPVRCPEGASGGEKIQVCLNGESKLFDGDNTSCETSSSSSYSSMGSLPPNLRALVPELNLSESVAPESVVVVSLPPTLPESIIPESIVPDSLPPTLPESIIPESIVPDSLLPTLPESIIPESYDELIFDAVAVQPSNSTPKRTRQNSPRQPKPVSAGATTNTTTTTNSKAASAKRARATTITTTNSKATSVKQARATTTATTNSNKAASAK
jgi:hypothetical protein